MHPPELFLNAVAGLGLELESNDLRSLAAYLDRLRDANQRMNLTAITEPDEMWMRHVYDALTLSPFLAELGEGSIVADIGSGGGAPALPLAIVFPHLRWTLIEATGKKATFLEATVEGLGLKNVAVRAQRAEDAGRDPILRDSFHAVTVRAVGAVAVVAELALPLVAVGGLVLLIKGEKAAQEIRDAKKALHMLHARPAAFDPETLPEGLVLESDNPPVLRSTTGRIAAIEKFRPTPRMYPRRSGEPKREPLGL